jgi:hypothetical protein
VRILSGETCAHAVLYLSRAMAVQAQGCTGSAFM